MASSSTRAKHAARASAGPLLLTQCMPQPPPVRRGIAHGADASPRARSPAPVAPRVRRLQPMLLVKAIYEAAEVAANMMSNVFGEACGLQETEFDVWTRRLKSLAARFCRGTLRAASHCPSLYTRPSGGSFSCVSAWYAYGRRCAAGTRECTRCQYIMCVYAERLAP